MFTKQGQVMTIHFNPPKCQVHVKLFFLTMESLFELHIHKKKSSGIKKKAVHVKEK